MRRREVLRLGGTALALTAGIGVAGAEDDADPRPETGGTLPSKNVPYTETGAGGEFLNEPSEIPAGDWILHDNGILSAPGTSKREWKETINQGTSKFVVDGEEFVLDEFADWEYDDSPENFPDRVRVRFEYFTPPKEKGKTYEMRWELEGYGFSFEDLYPLSNQIEIVGRD